MQKLCLVFNDASHYRESIYELIDKEYNCDWYFGDNKDGIKEFDINKLKNTTKVKNKFLVSHVYYQVGIIKLLFKKEYNVFLILGELNCLSTWLLLILNILFVHKKIYLWSHGWYGKEGLLKRKLKKFYFSIAEGTFLYGDYARKLMIDNGIQAQKLFVIHNSLNYKLQIETRRMVTYTNIYSSHFNNNWRNIIFIGRLTATKKLYLLLDALQILISNDCHINLTFVGDGSEKESLEEIAMNKGISQNVWFYGACYDEITNAMLLFNADVCVSPGNVGLTALHSMTYGTPVITHNCLKFQMPEFEAIKEGVTGSFFEYDNVDSLANSINKWIQTHKDNRLQVREDCYKEISQSWTPEYQMKIIKNNIIFK